MIEKEYNKYLVTCNICGDIMEEFDTWDEAKNWEDTEGNLGVCEDCR